LKITPNIYLDTLNMKKDKKKRLKLMDYYIGDGGDPLKLSTHSPLYATPLKRC